MLGLMLAAGMLTKVFVGILIAVHFLLCLFLIAVVLLQSGKAGDLSSAFGGGGGSQANVAAMSSENILTRATKISAFGFMLTSLLLALFAHGESGADSVLDVVEDESAVEGEAEPGTEATDKAAATDAPAPAESEAAPAGDESEAPAEETPAPAPDPAGDGS
jgi:preprotein translocase subunit SecG